MRNWIAFSANSNFLSFCSRFNLDAIPQVLPRFDFAPVFSPVIADRKRGPFLCAQQRVTSYLMCLGACFHPAAAPL